MRKKISSDRLLAPEEFNKIDSQDPLGFLVDYGGNVKEKGKTQKIKFRSIAEMMERGIDVKTRNFKDLIEKIRSFENGDKEKLEMKRKLPFFSLNGGSKESYAIASIDRMSEYEWRSARTDLMESWLNRNILAMFRSPSGDGLKLIVLISKKNGTALKKTFQFLVQEIEKITNTKIGEIVEGAKPCFLSYDKEAFINKSPLPLEIPVEEKKNDQFIPPPTADKPQFKSLEEFADKFFPGKRNKTASGYNVQCPTHQDSQPSLSISVNNDKILLHCHAGCRLEDILSAVALDIKDLFLSPVSERDGNGSPKIISTYPYVDEKGVILYESLRKSDKTFWQRRPDGKGGHAWNMQGVRRVLYRLPELIEAVKDGKVVFVVEGEKDVERLVSLGLTATTNPQGAGKWRKEYNQYFSGVDVVVIPDNDDPGKKHADTIYDNLSPVAKSVKIVNIPESPKGGDVSDYFDGGGTVEGLWEIIKESEEKEDVGENQKTLKNDQENYVLNREDATIAEKLVHIGEKAELFHSPGGDLFASFPVKGHKEIAHIASRSRYYYWLYDKYIENYGKPPNTSAATTALEALKAKAMYHGEEKKIYTRIASFGDSLYIDLCNNQWEAVKVTADGWEIIKNPPVFFKRNNGMLALPYPQEGGSINDIWKFINVDRNSDGTITKDMVLILGWLFGCFMPQGAHVHMMLLGEQGTAKSTATRFLRSFVDPNIAPNNNLPRERRDLIAAANNSWVVAFDNVSFLEKWLSDDLCRLSTGAGSRDRELYTNTNEIISYVKRPVIFNGINEVVTRGDLLDRLICITLKPIHTYKHEAEINKQFNADHPKIFKCILDNLVVGMRHFGSINLSSTPRMADFVQWNEAILSQWEDYQLGTFTGLFMETQREAVELQVQGSPIANALINYIDEMGSTKILPSALHSQLRKYFNEQEFDKYPKSATVLSSQIRRSASGLRKMGYFIEFTRSKSKRWVVMQKNESDKVEN